MQRLDRLAEDHQAFWQFSCDFYAFSDVAPLLIKLQDRYRLNVNRVLVAVWLALYRFRRFEPWQLDHDPLLVSLENWIAELRNLRRVAKVTLSDIARQPFPTDTYSRLLASELRLEKLHQTVLLTALSAASGPRLTGDPIQRVMSNLTELDSSVVRQRAWTLLTGRLSVWLDKQNPPPEASFD